MNKEDLYQEILKIEKQSEKDIRLLHVKFAQEHSPYKIGDIVTDHRCTIKIEKINIHIAYGCEVSSCIYKGTRLKKDGTPYKSGEHETVYEIDIKDV